MILTVTLNVSIDKAYWVEELMPGKVMRVQDCNYSAGGKGINVSKVAYLAGSKVIATGFVGGFAGAYVESQLAKMGLKCDFVHTQGETRSCINIVDNKTKSQTEFLEPGFTVSSQGIELLVNKFDSLLQGADIVTISGSVPRGCPCTIYQRLIEKAVKLDKKVILDTSGTLLAKGIGANPTMIKPNIDEMRALTGKKCTDRKAVIQSAVELHNTGISYVIVSMGRNGALLVCDKGVFQGVTPDIPVKNTVGCGDSMVAAFAVGFERGYTPEKMLRFAIAVSTANALTSETGFFRHDDLEQIYAQCSIVKVSI
jgi:tagatose 6-phosphate kinase